MEAKAMAKLKGLNSYYNKTAVNEIIENIRDTGINVTTTEDIFTKYIGNGKCDDYFKETFDQYLSANSGELLLRRLNKVDKYNSKWEIISA